MLESKGQSNRTNQNIWGIRGIRAQAGLHQTSLQRSLKVIFLISALASTSAFAASAAADLAAKIAAANPKLSPFAIRNAFHFLAAHEDTFKNKDYMTIINFDQPSTEERMYLINLKDGITKKLLVAHGKNSASKTNGKWAVRFSNVPNSKQSSLGFYRTLDKNESVSFTNSGGDQVNSSGVYYGKHGRSLRLIGLQSTNSKALAREVVIHGASYVSKSYIKAKGRLGLSWGCPAVENGYRDYVLDRVEGRSLYYLFKSDGKNGEAPEPKQEPAPSGPLVPSIDDEEDDEEIALGIKAPKVAEPAPKKLSPAVSATPIKPAPAKPSTPAKPKHKENASAVKVSGQLTWKQLIDSQE